VAKPLVQADHLSLLPCTHRLSSASSQHRFWCINIDRTALLFIVKRLALGFILITLTSGILLLSDWNRRSESRQAMPRIAILQHASQAVLDEGVQGIEQGLAEEGFTNGQTIAIQRFNAENDSPTENAIAREVSDGRFDMVVTASTLSLQAVAGANRAGRSKHVFGLVIDPFGAGVGISREDPLDHPKHLVGFGSMQPVGEAFRLAKQFLPSLSTVGVVWNPAESNSEAATRKARQASLDLGIRLLEATVDNSSGVAEAAGSLISRGVQALWVGGDVTVLVALDGMIAAAKKAGIPVFTNVPPSAQRGALFDFGANLQEVGRLTGVLAADVLHGADPAAIPVKNVVPEMLIINPAALTGLRESWQLPEEVRRRADAVVDGTVLRKKARALRTPSPGRTYKIGIAYFGPDPGVEAGMQGLQDGLGKLGFVQGQNLHIVKSHAQGEMGNVASILQNYANQDLDLIVPMTTPLLTGAIGLVKTKPAVFTVVYDPIAAGAGKTREDHVANITGVGSFPPIPDTVKLIRDLVPGVRTVGTVYNNSEANSRKVIAVAREEFRRQGIRLEEVAITNTSEVFQAAQVLTGRNIQAFWITGDNTVLQAFEGVVKVADDNRLPLIINDPEFTDRGALACAGLGFYQSGYAAATLAARVLLGEHPKHIPIEEVAVKKLVLNEKVARRLGITFSAELIKAATP
jgi:ABC-type uncharacterized transport system substrate-binding protein